MSAPSERAACNAATLRTLYDAFARKDGAGMAACYAPDAVFTDPVFVDLRGGEVGRMWRMLCAGAKDLRIEARDLRADDARGSAHWEAWYTFSSSGRQVHNVIEATFTFDEEGRILRHEDRFSFHRWARQALGLSGLLLGWTPFMRSKVRADVRRRLARFE